MLISKAKKMKNKINTILVILAMFGLYSCEKYTDITPKGKNLLSTADELEYLMNFNFSKSSTPFAFFNLYTLDNDIYFNGYKSVPKIINSSNKGLEYALITYDETIDRVLLSKTNSQYTGLYSIITTRLNMILEQAPNVTDDPAKVEQLKAEALTLRAYLHYILVNIHAKAYNPATAETDGGIAYMNKIDYEATPYKSTVAEVYVNLLSDINEALSLNSLPNQPVNYMRVSKGFAFAVKARILLSMRDYEGALAAANSSLDINSTLEDHRPFIADSVIHRVGMDAQDNLFMASSIFYNPSMSCVSKEIINNYYESGNIVKDYTSTLDANSGFQYCGVNGASLWYESSYEQNSAGMTTSDTYLIKAECLIRTGKISDGMNIINFIRERRINPSDYSAVTATSEAQAMTILKKVSRIEFLCTWKNFVNIKRWNTEDAYKETISRDINGTVYTLTPESPLWIFPFPQNATNYNPTLTQNY